MRRNILSFIVPVVLSVAVIVFACNKMETPPVPENEQTEAVTEDILNIQASIVIMDEVLRDLEKDIFLKSTVEPACPVRTVIKPQDGTYPRTIIQDFGDNCTDRFGIIRSGKIITTLTGPWLRKGTNRIVKFDNFVCNGIKIEGSKTFSCMGETKEGYIWHKIKGEVTSTNPKKVVLIREIQEDVYQIAGVKTSIPDDNEWLTSGHEKVTKSDGLQYTVQIINPLHRKYTCRWLVAGTKEIHIKKDKIVVDFGKGECDAIITRTINDGTPVTIDLQKKN